MLDPELKDLVRAAVEAALDKKAFQVAVLDVSELTSYADSFVVCSGASMRQLAAIADEVGLRLRALGRLPLHVEGKRDSEWVLIDYGDFIVHLFSEEKRVYYGLDSLWGDARRLTSDELGVDGLIDRTNGR